MIFKSAMHINVRDILAKDVGYNRSYQIEGERPDLEAVKLTEDIEGEVTLTHLKGEIVAKGRVTTAIELDCHRCLRTFARPITRNFQQSFTLTPGDDTMPIENDQIDLAPLLQQEILVGLPIKILCSPDCAGVPEAAAEYNDDSDTGSLRYQARIRKGK